MFVGKPRQSPEGQFSSFNIFTNGNSWAEIRKQRQNAKKKAKEFGKGKRQPQKNLRKAAVPGKLGFKRNYSSIICNQEPVKDNLAQPTPENQDKSHKPRNPQNMQKIENRRILKKLNSKKIRNKRKTRLLKNTANFYDFTRKILRNQIKKVRSRFDEIERGLGSQAAKQRRVESRIRKLMRPTGKQLLNIAKLKKRVLPKVLCL